MSSIAAKSVKSIVPLFDRVLIQRIKANQKTSSGIFLPEKSMEKLSEGTVIAVGQGAINKDGKLVVPGVKSGDRVVLPQYGGNNIKIGDDEYTLFRDHELMAIINE
ncbi:heat shock protein, mitochondrial [Neolecta irregularis DAH-3]|uniref:Heat shock protein, mitochondrial n=1 Tax=Neolecta irregularis (strain DAH-3) TaxID=1198029 RepID=A0A1U7LN70_NEOID|nr:heat shock protein, mitochondrial [Neolecta irregularis DAH-3]|eukprot:OLL23992.1 heat shock protein, mitochondrial [Neolecta irregularis DAH-3]